MPLASLPDWAQRLSAFFPGPIRGRDAAGVRHRATGWAPRASARWRSSSSASPAASPARRCSAGTPSSGSRPRPARAGWRSRWPRGSPSASWPKRAGERWLAPWPRRCLAPLRPEARCLPRRQSLPRLGRKPRLLLRLARRTPVRFRSRSAPAGVENACADRTVPRPPRNRRRHVTGAGSADSAAPPPQLRTGATPGTSPPDDVARGHDGRHRARSDLHAPAARLRGGDADRPARRRAGRDDPARNSTR